jgi:hypothetical protein
MKPKSLATAFAIGFFAVAFLRNGTAVKGVRQLGGVANTFTGGTAKISRRI